MRIAQESSNRYSFRKSKFVGYRYFVPIVSRFLVATRLCVFTHDEKIWRIFVCERCERGLFLQKNHVCNACHYVRSELFYEFPRYNRSLDYFVMTVASAFLSRTIDRVETVIHGRLPSPRSCSPDFWMWPLTYSLLLFSFSAFDWSQFSQWVCALTLAHCIKRWDTCYPDPCTNFYLISLALCTNRTSLKRIKSTCLPQFLTRPEDKPAVQQSAWQ